MTKAHAPFLQIYRINALRALGGLAFCLLAVSAPPPTAPVVRLVLEVFGTTAIFIAIAGRAWSLFYIGGRKNSELITDGPYSVTRNPLYLFSLIGISGVGVQSGSLLLATVFVVSAYLAFDMAMRGEEAYLKNRYRERFDDYRRVVPRLWPDFSLWRECQDIPLRSSSAIRSFRDGVVFLAAWATIELVAICQSTGVLPVVWTLPF